MANGLFHNPTLQNGFSNQGWVKRFHQFLTGMGHVEMAGNKHITADIPLFGTGMNGNVRGGKDDDDREAVMFSAALDFMTG